MHPTSNTHMCDFTVSLWQLLVFQRVSNGGIIQNIKLYTDMENIRSMCSLWLWTAAHAVTMQLWCTQSLLSLYHPSHTIWIHQVVSMSNKVISHQIPVLPGCGFRHVDIEWKKKSWSSRVVHTTVTISPQPKQIATPVPVAPSTSQVDTSGNDQNYIHDEPLRFGKVSCMMIRELCWLTGTSHKIIFFMNR